MSPKKDLNFMGFFEKRWGGGLTSVVQIYFDKGVQTGIMLSPNADLIAVSLAFLQGSKKPPVESSEGPMIRRNFLE